MKVLEIVAGLHRIGGVTTFVGGLSNALVDQGVDVTIATYRATGGADDFIPDSRVHVADVRTVRIDEYDAVHVHGLWDRDVFWASGTALAHDLPLVWSPHGMLAPWSLKFKRWKKFLPWHFCLKGRIKKADVLHVTASNEADWCRELGFVNRIEVIPLGTMLRSDVARAEKPEKTVLFVGRIHPVKGIENLLRAWALLSSSNNIRSSGSRLKLIGINDSSYRITLDRLIHELGIEHSVAFPGPKYGVDLDREYCQAWVSILPSFTENFGGVVIDALANGCPVIASTNTPWAMLPEQRCGWWTSNEPQSLAKVILEALSISDEERYVMGINGRTMVKESYSWQAVASKMKDVYESVVAQ